VTRSVHTVDQENVSAALTVAVPATASKVHVLDPPRAISWLTG
jgi:hypothetical protein